MSTSARIWRDRAGYARELADDWERSADRRRDMLSGTSDPWQTDRDMAIVRAFQAVADAWHAYADRCDEAAGSILADEHRDALPNTVGVVDLAEQATRGAS